MSDHLLRQHAPLSDRAWTALERDVTPRLEVQLAGRRLVDFAGPSGWDLSAIDIGRADRVPATAPEVDAHVRNVLPVLELRVAFALARRPLEDIDRGATDVDLDALAQAAKVLARAENEAVLHHYREAGLRGVTDASPQEGIRLDGEPDNYPRAVAGAVDVLRNAGIGGPYSLAIAPDLYTAIAETAEHGGYPLFDHLLEILGGQVVWAPGIEGGVVISQRGGDYSFECGQDISIGYLAHDRESVELYLEESFAFRINEDAAAVALLAPS